MNESLFYFVNTTLSNPLLDWTMTRLTDLHKNGTFVAIALPLLLAVWFWKKRWRALPVVLGLVMTIAASDNFTYRVLKPYFKHPRPPAVEQDINILSNRYAGYGFPSNHAGNMFAGATFLSLTYPVMTPVVFTLAAAVAFSRVYVGVHYPKDVLVGAIVGLIFGLFFFRLLDIILVKMGYQTGLRAKDR